MKRIIDGKRYDTDVARLVGKADGGGYPGDFSYWSEGLYKTKKGAFFLAGHGGPMSGYARHVGNSSSGSERITPLSNDEAFDWAEFHLEAEVVEAEFGEAIEDA